MEWSVQQRKGCVLLNLVQLNFVWLKFDLLLLFIKMVIWMTCFFRLLNSICQLILSLLYTHEEGCRAK